MYARGIEGGEPRVEGFGRGGAERLGDQGARGIGEQGPGGAAGAVGDPDEDGVLVETEPGAAGHLVPRGEDAGGAGGPEKGGTAGRARNSSRLAATTRGVSGEAPTRTARVHMAPVIMGTAPSPEQPPAQQGRPPPRTSRPRVGPRLRQAWPRACARTASRFRGSPEAERRPASENNPVDWLTALGGRCYRPCSPSGRVRVGANVRFPIAVGFPPGLVGSGRPPADGD